jgi:hypothetical protein
MNHVVILRIIVDECLNNKTNLLCCFVDFGKKIGRVSMTNLWNRLEEIRVPFKLGDTMVRLYENIIAKFRNTEGWSEEINYDIGIKKICSLSPTILAYNNKNNLILRSQTSKTPNMCMRPPCLWDKGPPPPINFTSKV